MEIVRIHEEEDQLSDQIWQFSVSTGFSDKVELRLQYYAERSRETRRHKWKVNRVWDRTNSRSYFGIPREAVPLPQDVVAEAIAAVKIELVE